MKYLCPSCERLVSPGRAVHHDARIEIVCPKCGEPEHIDLDTEEDNATSTEENEVRDREPKVEDRGREAAGCPKCGAPRSDQEACPKCGLVYTRWSEPPEEAPPAHVMQLWEKLEKRWDDQELHSKFVQEVFATDAMAFAARCYTTREDDIAEKQLEKLTLLGVQAMRNAEKPSVVTPRIARTVGWALFVLLCLTLLTLAALSLR